MKLKKIEIKNVKSFKDKVEVDFHNDFNILIGPNGSGKSNLLDIVTICIRHFFLKPYNVSENNDAKGFFKEISQSNPFRNIARELDKFYGDNSDSEIVLEFIVKQEDITNINSINANADSYQEKLHEFRNSENFNGHFTQIKKWNEHTLVADQVLTFRIVNSGLQGTANNNHNIFLEYLNYFEFILVIARELPVVLIHPNYLYFSPYRGANLQNLQANLSTQNFYEVLQSLISATSKTVFSLINLATLYFAQKRRKFEDEATQAGYSQKWGNDEEVKLVTKYLGKLGYGWNLKLVDKNKNIYEILLTKEEKEFYVNQASSGEKEIINFLLGVFAFNLNNGLIIIDEPELHLHPRWQNILLDLFIELSTLTKNQFIISTHSPTFINDKSYNHIFRVYKDENNVSKKIILKDTEEFRVRDILHIVNSTNNEKMFFADIVVLVEGITDRLIFQKVTDLVLLESSIPRIVELIEVKGKANKEKFTLFLDALEIPHFFITDLDYVNDIGDGSIQALFVTNKKKIEKDVIKNEKSKDGSSLVDEIENAIEKNDSAALKALWNYIKSFRRKIKSSISKEEVELLDKFIDKQVDNNVYILKRGDIEDYFPVGLRTKHLENVISLLQPDNFDKWKETTEFKELKWIIENIMEKAGQTTPNNVHVP